MPQRFKGMEESDNGYVHGLLCQIPDKSGHQTTNKMHLEAAAELARTFGTEINMPLTALISGWLHDFGKYSRSFQNVLNGTASNIDHAICAGRLPVRENPPKETETGLPGCRRSDRRPSQRAAILRLHAPGAVRAFQWNGKGHLWFRKTIRAPWPGGLHCGRARFFTGFSRLHIQKAGAASGRFPRRKDASPAHALLLPGGCGLYRVRRHPTPDRRSIKCRRTAPTPV